MKLEQAFIDEVLSRIDVIEIIEQRITLKKTGKANYSGLCPFHQEKTPSFTASQTKQFYYCFGCKASGNAIRFLMAYEKLSFHEAVEALAAKAGMALPDNSFKTEEKKPSIAILEQAAKYYQKQLNSHPHAKDYLNQRGLSSDIIAKFQLGFAPPGWENLLKSFNNTSESKKQLFEVGMLAQKDNKKVYDRFRDRIMFPICNRRGQIIAFGGRSLGPKLPKYLNSPESNFFHKSRELYGLYEALQANKQLQRIIIVEGYLDVIALHQYGLTETVATLGTAISIQHIQTLLRFTESLIFCFDGDLAGKTAAWRALEIAFPLMHTGLNIHFLFLPNGEDPDSFVRKVGAGAFSQNIQSATPLVDFFFQKLQAETELTSLAGKTRFVYLVDKYLQKQPQGIFHELMYERLSKLIGLSLEKVAEILNQNNVITKKSTVRIDTKSLSQPMRLAISLLLQSPKLLINLQIPESFSSIELGGIELLKQIMAIIRQNSQSTTGSLLEYLAEDEQKSLLSELAAQDLLIPDEGWQEELQGAFARITQMGQEQQIQALMLKGKKEGLTPEEKKLLQNLLISK